MLLTIMRVTLPSDMELVYPNPGPREYHPCMLECRIPAAYGLVLDIPIPCPCLVSRVEKLTEHQ